MSGKIIVLIEDNEQDELLTVRALRKNNIQNEMIILRDGAEALDYLFAQGAYAGRDMKGKVALYIGRGSRGMTAVPNRLIGARGRNAIEMHHAIAAIGPVTAIAGRGRGRVRRATRPREKTRPRVDAQQRRRRTFLR